MWATRNERMLQKTVQFLQEFIFTEGFGCRWTRACGWAQGCPVHPWEVKDMAQECFQRKAHDFPSTEKQDKAPECVKNALIKDLIFKRKSYINDLIKKWSNCFHNCFWNCQGLFSLLVIVCGVINHNPGDHSAPDNLQPYYQVSCLAGPRALTSCYLSSWQVQNSTNYKDFAK